MKFNKKESQIYIYNNEDTTKAFEKTTHLAIAAHQDDVEFMAYHGIVQCFGQKDKHFSAVITTNGSGSPRSGIYKNYTDQEMVEVRMLEQKKAAFVGEYATLSLLMYSSAEVKDNNNTLLVDDIYKILMASKPQVVYTHNLADKHDTHIATALKVIQAIRMMDKSIRPQLVLGCEVWRALDWMSDNQKIILDVSDKQNIASAVMGVFDSQITGGKQYDLATTGRRLANSTYSEFNSVDKTTHTTYAMDITPLIQNDELSILDYVLDYIDNFKADVKNKISSLI